jgi:hypothetical protein
MGYNTTILILNDTMHEIDDDPKAWWEETRENIYRRLSQDGPFPRWGGRGGTKVISNEHANYTNIIAVGGNTATILHLSLNSRHHEPQDKERIVREMASELGFYLVKKKKGK